MVRTTTQPRQIPHVHACSKDYMRILINKILYFLKKQNNMHLCGPQNRIVEPLPQCVASRRGFKGFSSANMRFHCKLLHFDADKRIKHQTAGGTPPNKTSSKIGPIHCRPCKRHGTSCKDLPLRPAGGLLWPLMGAKRLANGFARSSDLPAG